MDTQTDSVDGGTVVEGTVVGGTVVEGTVVEGTVADETVVVAVASGGGAGSVTTSSPPPHPAINIGTLNAATSKTPTRRLIGQTKIVVEGSRSPRARSTAQGTMALVLEFIGDGRFLKVKL